MNCGPRTRGLRHNLAHVRYARLAHSPVERLPGPDYRGVIDEWENSYMPGSDACVAEFGGNTPSSNVVRRHVAAALTIARGR